MYTIRVGIFETNSSTSHSLTLCTEEEYQKYLSGELVINTARGGLYTLRDALGEILFNYLLETGEIKNKKKLREALDYRRYLLHESQNNADIITKALKTKTGEQVIGISIYGEY